MTELNTTFISEIQALLGTDAGNALIQALDTEPVTAIRINERKGGTLPEALDGTPVAWHRQGRVLSLRPRFTLMPQWHAGAFYVQEPASMVIAEVIRRLTSDEPDKPLRYLDMCAAPGGKTTAAIGALPSGSFVVANEYVATRANILCENLAKWGAPGVAVCGGDTSALTALRGVFDIVAVDAPCSGEGMMRKDEQAREQWSPSLVRECASLQRQIVDNAWECLKPGGYLIYSTCTFNKYEDEDMLSYIASELGGESVDTGIAEDYGIPCGLETSVHALRFMPHRTVGEGLFMGVMRKPISHTAETGKVHKDKKGKKQNRKNSPTQPAALKGLLSDADTYRYELSATGVWRAIPREHTELVDLLQEHTHLLMAGVPLGTEKGRDFVPDAALALSTQLSETAYPSVEIALDDALNYLRREAITLPADAPRGYVVVKYAGYPLGFVKNLGNRANNLYPTHWRIRHL